MFRLCFTVLAFGALCFGVNSLAAEPTRFAAKLELETRQGDSKSSVMTTVGGPLDRPRMTHFGRVGDTHVELTVEPIKQEKTYVFLARFRVTHKPAGGPERVLAEPAILTIAGQKAQFFAGAEGKDYTQVEFTPELK